MTAAQGFSEYLTCTTTDPDACCTVLPAGAVSLSACTHLTLWKKKRGMKVPPLVTASNRKTSTPASFLST